MILAKCTECLEVLELENEDPTRLGPCPKCGALKRHYVVEISDRLTIRERLGSVKK